jgi:hypothetical protein
MNLTSKFGTPEFDAALRDAANTSQVATTLGIFVMNALRSNPDLDMAKVEDRLRELGELAHLVANPARFAPEMIEVVGIDLKPRPYSLWVCVHGEEETLGKFAEIGTADFDDNRSKLLETGFLAVKKTPPN